MVFFATSHGETPVVDGGGGWGVGGWCGGTLKCLVAKASLERPMEDQILNSI